MPCFTSTFPGILWKCSHTLFTALFSILFIRVFFFSFVKKHCFVDERIFMYYFNISQLLLVSEFAHWCAKISNFCWCANSHTGVRKKKTLAGIMWCFWGMFHKIETTTMEYLIAELARNLMNQKNIWNQIPNSKQLHFHMRKHQHRKS